MVKRRLGGFSFLEILFAMVFFMVILASFAMVFPAGYHLGFNNSRGTQASNLAVAVLQEVTSKPVYSPTPAAPVTGDSLQTLVGWTTTDTTKPGGWSPNALDNFYATNPAIADKFNYNLPPVPPPAGVNGGIVVNFLSGGDMTLMSDDPAVSVTITLAWTEFNNSAAIPRRLTLPVLVTYDR